MTDRIRYLPVRCCIDRVTRDAVGITNADPDGHPFAYWIPLSLLHTLDERTLITEMMWPGTIMTLRIVDWKVGQLRLTPTAPPR
jgi:hypothetical protein